MAKITESVVQPHEIIVKIPPTGKVIGEVKGVSGPSCGPLSAWLDEIGKVVEDRQTDDFDKESEQATIDTVKGRRK